jgi:Chitin synthase export chaperone
VTIFLLFRTERKAAAVGRREIQLFLIGYIIVEICEIFTVGGFPLHDTVRKGFTAVHLAAIVATLWILLLNALVGFQLLYDGTALSIGLILGSAAALFIGTGYIALDTAFSWTGYFDSSTHPPYRAIGLYVLYQLCPLVFLFLFFVLETILVVKILEERKPMLYLVAAALLFAIGQIFNYVISVHICNPTNGKIDGAFFETLFTLLSVVAIWIFWSSITEDDWPQSTLT